MRPRGVHPLGLPSGVLTDPGSRTAIKLSALRRAAGSVAPDRGRSRTMAAKKKAAKKAAPKKAAKKAPKKAAKKK